MATYARAMANEFAPLLGYLASDSPGAPQQWHGWTIAPVAGGTNNLLYRVESAAGRFAVKFTIRDARDRAGREYAALQALAETKRAIAPLPVVLDRNSYPQPVVVQTWLDGEPLSEPPRSDADWSALLDHYCMIGRVTPEQTSVVLPDAVTSAAHATAGRALIQQQIDLVPTAAQPPSLRALLDTFATVPLPDWPEPPRALCRVDANCRNIIRRAGAWASVDWENSGWGDPAFEIAEMITHPVYDTVSTKRWHWLIERYARQTGDAHAPTRIQAYQQIMLVWWVARLARYLHDTACGQDQRLVQHPARQPAALQGAYGRYLARAHAQIAAPSTM